MALRVAPRLPHLSGGRRKLQLKLPVELAFIILRFSLLTRLCELMYPLSTQSAHTCVRKSPNTEALIPYSSLAIAIRARAVKLG